MTVTAPVGPPTAYPLRRLQAEIVPALRQLLDGVCPVYDHVPEDAPAPYVTWTTGWTASRNALNAPVQRVWIQISIWSEYRGFAQAGEIAELIVTRFSFAVVRMDGWKPAPLVYEQAHSLRDGRHRHIPLTFRFPYVSPTTGG